MSARERLAAGQRELLQALVGGAPVPAGFDTARVQATSRALISKRAGEVSKSWPRLAVSLGPEFRPLFASWAAGRPPLGSMVDGYLFASSRTDGLPALGAGELADVRACMRMTDHNHLHPRHFFAIGRAAVRASDGGGTAVTYAYRGRILRRTHST